MTNVSIHVPFIQYSSIIWILVFFGTPFSFSQSPKVSFQHYQTRDGLTDSNVHTILQDCQGYLWIGTNNGLSRFDGYTFTNFLHQENELTSLSDNFVYWIYEDSEFRLWIATREGLNLYHPKSQSFTRFIDGDYSGNINANEFTYIAEDPNKNLWLGTKYGLVHLNRSTQVFTRFIHDPNNPSSISHNNVSSILIDRSGVLWIGTVGGGLNRYDSANRRFTHYVSDASRPDSIKSNDVLWVKETRNGDMLVSTWDIGIQFFDRERGIFRDYPGFETIRVKQHLEDREGKIWIATWDNGLYCTDAQNRITHHFQHDNADSNSLSSDTIVSLYEDRSGMIWIGTLYGGVNMVNHKIDRFVNYVNFLPSKSANNIYSLMEDRQRSLWLGSYKHGLLLFDRENQRFDSFQIEDASQDEWKNTALSLLEDRRGRFWVGGYGTGLHCFDPVKKTFLPRLPFIQSDLRKSNSYWTDSVRSIIQDREGFIWIATDNNGLLRLDESGTLLTQYLPDPNDPTSISYREITCLYEDRSGTLWIGTEGGGLNAMDLSRTRFRRYCKNSGNPHSISHDRISFITETKSNELWIGTVDGLNRLNRETGQFDRFNTHDGLPSNKICGIAEDSEGNLWISTNFGISKFNLQTGSLKNYDHRDGMLTNEFITRSVLCTNRGEFMMGGMNGFMIFEPTQISENHMAPPIALTKLTVMGNPVKPEFLSDPENPLTITYNDKYISFEFTALDFTNTMKNQYAYQLEGFDTDWIYCGNRRFANYTNLNPGTYTLRVKGSNSDGYWNETGASLSIIVLPPFWITWWFRLAIAFLLMAVFSLWYWQRIRHYKQNQKMLQEQVEQRTSELRQKNEELERTMTEREEAMKKIKVLSGLIPICANCKKVRSDKGYWNQIEVYIAEHSEADFTHSLCPDCIKKLYPQYSMSSNKPSSESE